MGNTAQTISPTSGETEFNPQIDEIIEEAYERTGVLGTRTGYQLRSARRSLNIMFQEWGNRGVHLWKVKLAKIPLVEGQAEYNFASDSTNFPEDIDSVLEAYYRNNSDATAPVDIALTKRGKSNGKDIPMCGVPFHSADNYLPKLIKKGFNVAVCEQTETAEEAKLNLKKGPLKREVVRIISPGTLTEDNLLERKNNNYLGAISLFNGSISVAWVDVSTGYFKSRRIGKENNSNQKQLLTNFMLRKDFSEILISDDMDMDYIIDEWHPIIKKQS